MRKYKVCVYAICKNEEAFVARWMKSMQEADLIVVTDTGSTDETVKTLREHGAVVYEESIKPWRFDVARNISLSHVPDDVDICVCTDLDEEFEPGWREHLENGWQPDATTGRYIYNWSINPDGSPGTQFLYFKIHTKNEYTWKYPIHECLVYTGGKPEKIVRLEGITLNHYPDATKSRGSYLPLLEMGFAEDPQSDRLAYYLGREYMYAGQWKNCIRTLKIHLSLPAATWKEERCASMRWIAKSYYQLGEIQESYRWYYRAIAEVPSMRDAYVEFAKTAYLEKDWLTSLTMAETALRIQKKSDCYTNLGYAWDHTPYDLAAIAAYHLNMYERAARHALYAIKQSPKQERLYKNMSFILDKLESKA